VRTVDSSAYLMMTKNETTNSLEYESETVDSGLYSPVIVGLSRRAALVAVAEMPCQSIRLYPALSHSDVDSDVDSGADVGSGLQFGED
jgi:hypothetical protein